MSPSTRPDRKLVVDEELLAKLQGKRVNPALDKVMGKRESVPPSKPFLRGFRRPAISAMILVSGLLALEARSISQEGFYARKTLFVAITLVPFVFAMFFFPGRVDMPWMTTRQVGLAEILDGLEPHERTAWLVALVIGIIAGATLRDDFIAFFS